MTHELPIKVGNIVRIKCHGIVAVGPVRSCYGEWVYGDDGEFLEIIIGQEVAGIEMDDITRNPDRSNYRYWKSMDGGTVEMWESEHPGKWVSIYPRTIGGYTSDERRKESRS